MEKLSEWGFPDEAEAVTSMEINTENLPVATANIDGAKKDLQKIIDQDNLEIDVLEKLTSGFQTICRSAVDWRKKASLIVVTDKSQVADMKMARIGRLELASMRIEVEKGRKAAKQKSLLECRAIDGIANIIKGLIVPIEKYLYEQENYCVIKAKEEAAERLLEIERQQEIERRAKEKAEAEERERLRKENEQLQKEREKADEEKQALEDKARIEREKSVAKQKEIEKVKKELEEQEMQAEADKLAIIEKAKQEKKELEKKLKKIECPYCHKTFPLPKG